ncbi:MAG: lysylphosphatidylglycerol synthase transmembrane domain-containing protein [Acidimicrobiales bacterium]
MAKKILVTGVRVLLSVGLLALVLARAPDFDFADLIPEWTATTGLWLLGAVILSLLSVVVAAWRWQQTAIAVHLHVGMGPLTRDYFAGQFVSNALPTTIGGDVLRIARLSKYTGNTEASAASVVLERLTGWIVLPAITIIGFLLVPELASLGRGALLALLIAVVTMAGLLAVLYAASHQRVGGRYADREGWQRFIHAVHVGVVDLRDDPAQAARVLGVAFLYQAILVTAAWMAARVVDIPELGIREMIAFFPTIAIAQVLPISIGGIGVRESLFVVFLEALGMTNPEPKAVSLGILLYLLTLVASLPGALTFVTGAPVEESPTVNSSTP